MTQPSPSVSAREAWDAAAAAVLRKSGRLSADAPDREAAERLARHTVEGVQIPALATGATDLATIPALAAAPGAAPYLRGGRRTVDADLRTEPGAWDIRAQVSGTDPAAMNAAALAHLAGGAQSLWLQWQGAGTPDLPTTLAGVPLDRAPVVLDVGGDTVAALRSAHQLRDLAQAAGVRVHPAGSLGADPIGEKARRALVGDRADSMPSPDDPSPSAASPTDLTPDDPTAGIAEIAALATDLGVGALVVDATVAHDAGAGDAGEIGYALAVGSAYLRSLTSAGVDIDTACGLMSFRFAVTDEQFTSIAKVRAARLVWHRVCELSGAGESASAQRQHAVTSRAMMTRYDRYVNMLRGAVATFAAAAGGADAVTTLPFTEALGAPDEFADRIARNVSALLAGESQLGAVADPAGGAYAVEELTVSLARAAWAEFGEIEVAGGILAALGDGSLAARIDEVRGERLRRVATRRQAITGVSEFPRAAEHLAEPEAGLGAPVRRWAAPFESMRDAPVKAPVRLVALGSQARATARVSFAKNLLAAGGIAVRPATVDEDLTGQVVMVAGADADYATDLAVAATAARASGASAVYLAGRPAGILATLPAGLIDGSVAVGDDVIASLSALRSALGVAS